MTVAKVRQLLALQLAWEVAWRQTAVGWVEATPEDSKKLELASQPAAAAFGAALAEMEAEEVLAQVAQAPALGSRHRLVTLTLYRYVAMALY